MTFEEKSILLQNARRVYVDLICMSFTRLALCIRTGFAAEKLIACPRKG
jgi:hypothetical protein